MRKKNLLLPALLIAGLSQHSIGAQTKRSTSSSLMASGFKIDKQNQAVVKAGLPKCQKHWTEITGLALQELNNLAATGKIDFPGECRQATEKLAWEDLISKVFQSCSGAQNTWKLLVSECNLSFAIYRSVLIDVFTTPLNNQPENYDSLKDEVLINKLFARFFHPWTTSGEKQGDHLLELFRIQEKIAERHPTSFEFAKIGVVLHFLKNLNSSKKEDESRLVQALEQAEKLEADDQQLKELRWYLLRENHLQEEYEKAIQDYLKTHPEREIGHYHLASVYWQKKNRRGTIRTLEAAVKKFPQSERIKNVLEAAKKKKVNDTIFSFQIFSPFTQL
jgi:hypothetical protein